MRPELNEMSRCKAEYPLALAATNRGQLFAEAFAIHAAFRWQSRHHRIFGTMPHHRRHSAAECGRFILFSTQSLFALDKYGR